MEGFDFGVNDVVFIFFIDLGKLLQIKINKAEYWLINLSINDIVFYKV
jgi:hypothetical protein